MVDFSRRFKRKKKITDDVLDKIRRDITKVEEEKYCYSDDPIENTLCKIRRDLKILNTEDHCNLINPIENTVKKIHQDLEEVKKNTQENCTVSLESHKSSRQKKKLELIPLKSKSRKEIRAFISKIKRYKNCKIESGIINDEIFVGNSKIPKSFLKRTENLIYLTEYLKTDGTISIIKRQSGPKGTSLKGDILWINTDPEECHNLKKMVQTQFPGINIFDRSDGFGISSLALAVSLSEKFGIPVGKKEEFCITQPNNNGEARKIIQAAIDAEGNVDIQGGNVVIANKSMEYLKGLQELLQKKFNINAVKGREIMGYGTTNTICINKKKDIEKLSEIGTLSERKLKIIRTIVEGYKKYEKYSSHYLEKVKKILSTPHTISEISNMTSIPYFIIKNRILKRLKPKIVGTRKTKSSRVANVYQV